MNNNKSYKKRSFVSGSIFLLVASFLIPLSAPAALAQVTTGTIKGVVMDSAGAVVPDADVTARDTATGIDSKTKANGNGQYIFPKLNPGSYTLSVQKQGYKRQEFQMVSVQLGQEVTLDATLQAGQVSETVTVTASGEELIQRQEIQVSNTFETRQIADLPSNVAGGGIDTLALLAPGVTVGFGNVNGNGTVLSVNGQRSRSNNFTIDGGDNNDPTVGGPAFFVDNQDSVAAFQVVTSNFSAEYGRNQGAIVNIVTKSGTNQYHGTAGWFHRDNNFLNSLDNIEKSSGLLSPSPDLNNTYEGTFGGPIIKDKLFFFGSVQYITDRSTFIAFGANPTIAPSGLGALAASAPNNPVIQALAHQSAFALTNFGSVSIRQDRSTGTVAIGGVNYPTAYPERAFATPFNEPEFSVRGDYKITDKHSIWFREFYQNGNFVNALGGSNGFTGSEPFNGKLSTLNFTSQLSNTLVNEFRFIRQRLFVLFGGGCTGTNCIPDPSTTDSFLSSFTNISFSGLHDTTGFSLQTIGGATNLPQGRTVTTYQWVDNVSKTMGKHQLKFGVDLHREQLAVPFLPNSLGAFRFGTSSSIVNNTPSATTIGVGALSINYNETDVFPYFQDDWRIKDNLTLNLGIRYENEGQPVNTLHDISTARESNPATAIWLQSLPLSARTFPEIRQQNHNFAPRLGFAWSPHFGENKFLKTVFGENDKSVISGGYSIAYDPGFYNIMLNVSTSSPLVFLNNVPFALPANPTGANVVAQAKALGVIAVNTFNPAFFSQTIVQNDFRAPYAEQWSLRWQREITRTTVFEARYVGTHGVGLFATNNGNPRFDRLMNGFSAGGFTFPGFPNLVPAGLKPLVCTATPGNPNNTGACNGRLLPDNLIRSRNNTAQSMYHGLQTRLQTRLANQLSLGVSYTFAKALDNASEIFSFGFETAYPQDPFSNKNERGYSGYDRRNALALNFIWDIPLFKNKQGFVGKALGGWQLNGTYFLENGQRYTPSGAFQTDFLGIGYEDVAFASSFFGVDALRPFIGNIHAPQTTVGISQVDANLAFGVPVANKNGFYDYNQLNTTGNVVSISKDQARYIINGPGADTIFGTPFGNASRGSLIGPTLNNVNLGIFKNFRFKERFTFQARLEMFNALNHPNPGTGFASGGSTPDNIVEDAGPTGFAQNGGIELARRVIVIGMKFTF